MKRTLLFVLALIVVACSASADVMRLDQIVRPPRNPLFVQLLLERPDTSYTPIALIEVSDDGWGLSLEDLRDKLVEEAAKIGGHAVILLQTDSDSGVLPVGQSFIPTAPADLVAARGNGDRRLYVVPSLDLVVVRLGAPTLDAEGVQDLNVFDQRVLEAA